MSEDKTFSEMLKASFKSDDTEEWLDVHFTRPIGLMFALMWRRLGVHPNAVTILSIFLGLGAAIMFYHTDVWLNLIGVVLLMLANFCDSTDGQLARLTNQKTLIGRMLDGFASNMWFFFIYVAICLRLMPQPLPGAHVIGPVWGAWIWVLAFIAGVLSHSPQGALADYYRQIHLFFLLGSKGSELNTSDEQQAIYDSLPKRGAFWEHAFYYNYTRYCKGQEMRTPNFQRLFAALLQRYHTKENIPEQIPDEWRRRFLDRSRPLMPYTNLLTFNARAITIYITCLLNCPWVYLLVEIVVFNLMAVYMHNAHERLCREMLEALPESAGGPDGQKAPDGPENPENPDNPDNPESPETPESPDNPAQNQVW